MSDAPNGLSPANRALVERVFRCKTTGGFGDWHWNQILDAVRAEASQAVGKEWARLASDLLTFADHYEACPSNGWGVEHRNCTCGLRDLSIKAAEQAEAMIAAAPDHPSRGEGS